jgi:tRNA wybutosine-synthesizing protein 2
LPAELEPYFPDIGRYWQEELGVSTVLRVTGPVSGTYRTPRLEVIAGTETETEVVEYGVRFRFDARRLLFARGNRTERHRIRSVVRPGEVVVDLFAGIGYFSIPAALAGAHRVYAAEVNPLAFRFLQENARRNRVSDRLEAFLGDNRTVPIPRGEASRVVLGYLPSSLPWATTAVRCLRVEGGWLHVHLVTDVRESNGRTAERVGAAVAPALIVKAAVRDVKPYGPGRVHRVVDAFVRPVGSPASTPRS